MTRRAALARRIARLSHAVQHRTTPHFRDLNRNTDTPKDPSP
jgi:hypothetical protein